MTTLTYNNKEVDGSTYLMTGLNAIALSLWVGLDYYFFPLLIWPLVAGLLARPLLQAGTPTGWRLAYLEGANFLTAAVSTPADSMGHSLLLLWGPEAQGDFVRWVQLGGLWAFVALHGAFALIGFMLRQFEIARLVGIRPYNAIAFSGPIAVFVSVFLIYPLGQSSWFFRSIFWSGSHLPIPSIPSGLPQLDPEPLPYDGSGRHPWWSTSLCYSWSYS